MPGERCVPKWHTGGAPRRCRSPPFPLRVPSVSPPYPLHTQKVTLSVPFWHSSGCPGHSKAGGNGGVSEGAIWIDVPAGGGPPAGVGQCSPAGAGVRRTCCVLGVACCGQPGRSGLGCMGGGRRVQVAGGTIAVNSRGMASQPCPNPKKVAAQNVRGVRALAEQLLRGGAADCEELGGF